MDNNNLPQEKLQLYQFAYKLFDRNQDGHICKDDLKKILNSLSQEPTDDELTDIMNELSQNGDTIDFVEFLSSMVNKTNENDRWEELSAAFKIFDKDSDGLISKSELKEGLACIGENLTEDELEEIIKESGSSGAIDYKGFMKLMNITL